MPNGLLDKKIEEFRQAIVNIQNIDPDLLQSLKLLETQFGIFFSTFPKLIVSTEIYKLHGYSIAKLSRIGEHESEKVEGSKVLLSVQGLMDEDPAKAKSHYFIGLLKLICPNYDSRLEALYQGTLEALSNSSEIGETNESDEFTVFDLMSRLLDSDEASLSEAIVYADPVIISSLCEKKGINQNDFYEIMDIANHNYKYKETPLLSEIGDVQERIFRQFLKQNPSNELLADFAEAMRLNADLFSSPQKYSTLPIYEQRVSQQVLAYMAINSSQRVETPTK